MRGQFAQAAIPMQPKKTQPMMMRPKVFWLISFLPCHPDTYHPRYHPDYEGTSSQDPVIGDENGDQGTGNRCGANLAQVFCYRSILFLLHGFPRSFDGGNPPSRESFPTGVSMVQMLSE